MPTLVLPTSLHPEDAPSVRLQQLAIAQVRTALTTAPVAPEEDQARLRAQLRGLHTLPHSRLRR